MIENLENEEWKIIEDFPNYAVSNKGRVKRLGGTNLCKEDRLIAQTIDRDGYPRVHLCQNGIRKKIHSHRLIAQAFIPNYDPENKTQVNHIDENKQNNVVFPPEECNLEWVSLIENINWGTRNERCASKRRGIPLREDTKRKISVARKGSKCPEVTRLKNSKPVYQINNETGEIIKLFSSAKDAERYFTNGNITGLISKVCKQNYGNNTAYGYGWRWA